MAVSDSGRLKVIAVRSRWAYEELVFSEKMGEWNRLCSERGKAFEYLKEQYGSRWGAVKALRRMLREAGCVVPVIDHTDNDQVIAERKRIAIEEMWVIDELAYENKKQEAVVLFETVGAMFRYLTATYGGAAQVLEMLVWLERTQSGRLKTLWIEA